MPNKYLYCQDLHCKGISPIRRLDNYYESWLLKFKEILSIAKKNKADAIIDGGDPLDQPIISTQMVDAILDLIEETNIPYYVLYGSHAMAGHHRNTSDGSSLTHMLNRCKLLKSDLTIEDKYAIFNLIEHEFGVEEKIKENGLKIEGNDDKWKICVTHCMITPTKFRPEVSHIVASELDTNYDLILTAHWHQPWNKKIGNTEFLNPGCIGRTEISEANIKPSVVLLDTKTRSYEIIELKKAKPGNQVFDLSKKDDETERKNDLEDFISSLKGLKSQSLDLRGNIENIAKINNTDREVVDLIINKMSEIEALEVK